jgi:hypothetical protein
VWALIRFLNAWNVCPIEIYCQLIAVYGEGVTNESNPSKWYQMFNKGRSKVHSEGQSGHPVPHHWGFENQDWSTHQDKQVFYSWWNSRETSSNFLFTDSWNCYRAQELVYGCSDVFGELSPTVIIFRTKQSHFIPESKHQSLEWNHSHSPSKHINFKHTLSTRKSKPSTLHHIVQTLTWLRRAIQNRWQGQLSTEVVLLHNSLCPHTAASTCATCWLCLGCFSPSSLQCGPGSKWFSLVHTLEVIGWQAHEQWWRSEEDN